MFRLMVADVDSPSYFVATAAASLGFFKAEGIDIEFEPTYGARNGPERLRDGTAHFFGGPAYAATRAFPGWKGAKLLCALSQYSYWFMAVRSDLDVKRGDVRALKGLRISSSRHFPEMGLRHMLAESGIDLERDRVRIVPMPAARNNEHAKGHAGVAALQQGIADAYWGNGMRLAIGESLGVAKLHLDLRRAALRRWAARRALVQFRRADDDGAVDPRRGGDRGRRGARDRQSPEGAQSGPSARGRRWASAVSCGRGGADRGADRA